MPMTKLESLKERIKEVCFKIEPFGVNTVGLRDFNEHVTEIPEGMYKSLSNWLAAFNDNEVADLLYINGYFPLEKRLQYKNQGKTDFQEYVKFEEKLRRVKAALRECPGAFKRSTNKEKSKKSVQRG